MTPLRQRMVEDMRVRNLAANTQRAYLQLVQESALSQVPVACPCTMARRPSGMAAKNRTAPPVGA